jgi:hypothetical protein
LPNTRVQISGCWEHVIQDAADNPRWIDIRHSNRQRDFLAQQLAGLLPMAGVDETQAPNSFSGSSACLTNYRSSCHSPLTVANDGPLFCGALILYFKTHPGEEARKPIGKLIESGRRKFENSILQPETRRGEPYTKEMRFDVATSQIVTARARA